MTNSPPQKLAEPESRETKISLWIFLVSACLFAISINYNSPPGLECRPGGYECAGIILGSFGAACTVGCLYAIRSLLKAERGSLLNWVLLLLNGVPASVFLFFVCIYLNAMRQM